MARTLRAAADRSRYSYLYGVVAAEGAERTARAAGTGVDSGPVETVRSGPVAALVGALDRPRIRPSRANVLAHQQVVARAHAIGPVVPVRFATVMDGGRTELQGFLADGAGHFEGLLNDFDGRDEYRLRVRYLPEVALREVVAGNRSIQRLRDRVRSAGHPRPADQLALGEQVAAVLADLRHLDATALVRVAGPHVESWRELDDGSEDVAAHLALMVDRGAVGALEDSLERYGRTQRQRLQVELVGPLPLWDFVPELTAVA